MSPTEADLDDDLDRAPCPSCDGEGWVWGDDLNATDPGWYTPDELYPCENCGGSGRGEDAVCW